jgi:hypothetical protein
MSCSWVQKLFTGRAEKARPPSTLPLRAVANVTRCHLRDNHPGFAIAPAFLIAPGY